MSDQVNWPKDLGSPVYYNIVDKLSKGNMVIRRHEPTKTSYAYFNDGSGLVSYDDPQSVCDKAGYVHDNLLGGLFVWEMSGRWSLVCRSSSRLVAHAVFFVQGISWRISTLR